MAHALTSLLGVAATAAALSLAVPPTEALIDDMRNTVEKAFHGWPDRLFILSPDGTIAYRGDRGPRGFKVDEMQSALEKILAAEDGK